MAFAQGKFGIEYNPNPIDEESSGAGWLVVVIALAAVAVLAAAGVRRLVSSAPDEPSPIDTPVAAQTTSVRIEDKPKSVGAPLRGDREDVQGRDRERNRDGDSPQLRPGRCHARGSR